MNTKSLMLIISLFLSALLSSCTTVVVHRPTSGGHQQFNLGGQEQFSNQRDLTGRPIGELVHTHTNGEETAQASVHFRIGADSKNQALVDQIRMDLSKWYADAHLTLKVRPTEEQCREKLKALFKAQPSLCHLEFSEEKNKRGTFGITKYASQDISSTTKVDGTPTVTKTPILKESDIPAAAKRLPAVRGPEEWQPKKPQKPQGYRAPQNQPQQPDLPE